MKQLQNNFTTPEQSKRLLELGVPVDSADCAVHTANYDSSIVVMSCGYTYLKWIEEVYGCQEVAPYLPCWSVGRLIEIYNICAHGSYTLTKEPKDLIEQILSRYDWEIRHVGMDFSKLEE